MITPNKVVSIEKSALGLVGVILEQGPDPLELVNLYQIVSKQFESIDQFLLVIDLLYVLGRIEVNLQTRTIYYVG
jgi:hypothetical protein